LQSSISNLGDNSVSYAVFTQCRL